MPYKTLISKLHGLRSYFGQSKISKGVNATANHENKWSEKSEREWKREVCDLICTKICKS